VGLAARYEVSEAKPTTANTPQQLNRTLPQFYFITFQDFTPILKISPKMQNAQFYYIPRFANNHNKKFLYYKPILYSVQKTY